MIVSEINFCVFIFMPENPCRSVGFCTIYRADNDMSLAVFRLPNYSPPIYVTTLVYLMIKMLKKQGGLADKA